MSNRVRVRMDIMGYRSFVMMTPKQAAAHLHRVACARALKAAHTRKADAMLAAYKTGEGTAEDAVEAISRRVGFCNSHERLFVMLTRLSRAPREVFWPVFCEFWPRCDATWCNQDALLSFLQLHAPAILPPDEQEVFDALPEYVRVFRGCSRERTMGLSWTTEWWVAENFARGHRFIAVPDPIIATGIIAKADILITNGGRNEHEVLLDPDRLLELSVCR